MEIPNGSLDPSMLSNLRSPVLVTKLAWYNVRPVEVSRFTLTFNRKSITYLSTYINTPPQSH